MTDREEWLAKNPLRAWRERQKPRPITQLEAASRIGCSPSTIRLWEQGSLPNWGYASRLAKLLGYESGDDFHKAWVKWQRKMMPGKPGEEAA